MLHRQAFSFAKRFTLSFFCVCSLVIFLNFKDLLFTHKQMCVRTHACGQNSGQVTSKDQWFVIFSCRTNLIDLSTP